MEAAGIEPASADVPVEPLQACPALLVSPGRPECRHPTAGPAILESRAAGDWLSFGASPFVDAATRTTGRIRSDASPSYLGSECEFVIRTYCFSRLFYEADRGPRLAAQPEYRPRRNQVAPVCPLQRFYRRVDRVAGARAFLVLAAALSA